VPGKTGEWPSLLSLQRFGQDLAGLGPVRRSFGEGGSASFVRTHLARLTPQRPSHPAPYVRDDREASLLWGRDKESSKDDLGRRKSGIFLQMALDREMTEYAPDLPVGQIRAT
jgi:hypothetical protein